MNTVAERLRKSKEHFDNLPLTARECGRKWAEQEAEAFEIETLVKSGVTFDEMDEVAKFADVEYDELFGACDYIPPRFEAEFAQGFIAGVQAVYNENRAVFQ